MRIRNLVKKRRFIRTQVWLNKLKIFVVAYLFFCTLLYFGQQRLIFFPARTLNLNPRFYHLKYQDVWLPVRTQAGLEKIHGWWIPSEKPQAPVILYFHHNAINIGANVSQARNFQQLGFSVLLIDYRGFGRSTGSFPNELQVYQDAEFAWNYLTQVCKIPTQQIFIYGHSVGGAIAIDLAVKHPDAAGLIVQSSFTSLRDMTKRFGLYWLLPIDFLLHQKFDSLQKIRSLQIPVLFIHGTADPQIPASMSQKLYAAAPQPKQLLLIPQAGHDNHMKAQYDRLMKQSIEMQMRQSQSRYLP